ncbi:ribonucleoside-diphosphate reductase, adenosylcobalamin-dependent [Candidatus Curtissbacteria bacterium RIFCSPHIGHO2_01_FULL_41_44]|uniref:Vitamin B12-dependent ribonucleotide reductase n=1 Tax=Candidatus Curtissbacteria bacterium RIFCSPLOWO2_01_FULL_42_50 TaxID=1797730 RepID=A0A1F5H3J7_9BACT|nr:MAG: ribonucleoside-diphosphate reductase, adenosylcobalamin-dependent [Candidatus Curtissbacteria bacterium RIFCSPHIGHO2_01_FULL_41_44]OGD94652.1 MAG: ribonucleoside-diphosphate reductase, adenosylcobalamin-dependent [Candidatus Curtissbacteria bacterium RIFCSPHIGHO2_02_FULL_42_58]OGD96848.1 MAG: ribonucleoside-diphosphate reductase, adenosylcobalamin-dependent [Candidatus Curtissbacteria bacterium RIFCSPHIGHO2_12_FULL_42_33]OGD98736.1 MAG: ribonucleoside-diphosphate reductase, adenosylcobal
MKKIKAKLSKQKLSTHNETREDARKVGRKIPPAPRDLFEPTLSENAAYIAKTRYAFRNDKGEPIETPKEMFWRVAYYVAAADTIYSNKKTHLSSARKFYELMASQKFIPNTPTLVNSGKIGQSLAACFVLPIEDDMESILKTMRDMAMIHKMGGGTGFSFSRLRPRDDIIGTSRGKSTGPVAFLQAYNDVTSQIRQGGVRRGANMGILHYTHPDILRFAVHKVDEFSLTNFNISITVTEDFMEMVKEDAKFTEGDLQADGIIEEIKKAYAKRDLDLKNVRIEEGVKKLYDLCRATQSGEGYDLINPRTGEVADRLNAKSVFDLITRLAWQYGDPGMVLIDRINNSRANPTPSIGQIEATNPCAEQPLLPYDACTLGSINLSKFVEDSESNRRVEDPEQSRRVNWNDLKDAICTAIHFLDNVLDMNEYPVSEIDKMTSMIRRVGLGVMGWADMLVKLSVGYNTPEGFELAEKVMQFVQCQADNASCDLAKIRGVFPAFKRSIYSKKGSIRPRNGARTTIAPTGTISMLADCSSGIEPHFALTFAKNTIEGKRLFNTNPYFLEALKERGIYSEELLIQIEKNHGSCQNLEELPLDLKKIFMVAGDIAPQDHVRMEAAFQKYTDNGISKTINFSNEASVEDVRQAYWLTYELGCRMITIYRDGSRIKQVLEVKKDGSYYDQLAGRMSTDGTPREEGNRLPQPRKKPTPTEAWGMRIRKKADVGYVYTSVFRDINGVPVEVFVTIGKTGGYVAGAAEVTGRLASRALKYGASLEEVASDLVGISCGTPYGIGPDSALSAFDAVGKSLIEIARARQLQLPISEQSQETTIETVIKTDSIAYANGHTNGVSAKSTNGQSPSDIAPNGNGQSLQMSLPPTTPLLDTGMASGVHEEKIIENKFVICPDCSSPVVYSEGCRKCVNPTCGWSKCS